MTDPSQFDEIDDRTFDPAIPTIAQIAGLLAIDVVQAQHYVGEALACAA